MTRAWLGTSIWVGLILILGCNTSVPPDAAVGGDDTSLDLRCELRTATWRTWEIEAWTSGECVSWDPVGIAIRLCRSDKKEIQRVPQGIVSCRLVALPENVLVQETRFSVRFDQVPGSGRYRWLRAALRLEGYKYCREWYTPDALLSDGLVWPNTPTVVPVGKYQLWVTLQLMGGEPIQFPAMLLESVDFSKFRDD
jgi:hypothetical protein